MYIRLFIIYLIFSGFVKLGSATYENWTNLTDCSLPSICRFQKVNTIIDASGIEKILGRYRLGLRCNIAEGFKFQFNISQIRSERFLARCLYKLEPYDGIIELSWPNKNNETLDSSLNIGNLFNFIVTFQPTFSVNLINIKRF